MSIEMRAAKTTPEASETRETRHQLTDALASLEAIETMVQRVQANIKHALKPTPNAAFNPASNADLHRRLHRPGRPRRIDADPELRAFVLERIEVMTFEELAEAIAQQFPPERRIGKSAIHDWFHNARR